MAGKLLPAPCAAGLHPCAIQKKQDVEDSGYLFNDILIASTRKLIRCLGHYDDVTDNLGIYSLFSKKQQSWRVMGQMYRAQEAIPTVMTSMEMTTQNRWAAEHSFWLQSAWDSMTTQFCGCVWYGVGERRQSHVPPLGSCVQLDFCVTRKECGNIQLSC